MTAFQNRRFADETVELNGSSFSDCSFERCHLRYCGGGDFSFRGCSFIDVVWLWEGAALNTLRMLSAMYNHLGSDRRRDAKKIIDAICAGTI
jgi:hypothetical protein